mmetsp:Transcript_32494/g.40261  ORF Transcript_32494/g.40261 Transcript_32494/m.40261 type:complete len:101 (+) Transcript_32494:802-1104(+)
MSEIFNTCTPISNSSDVSHLYSHYSNGYQYMAMTDYPYPAAFLEPMPAWPIKEAVKPFADIPSKSKHEESLHHSGITAYWINKLKGAFNRKSSALSDRER